MVARCASISDLLLCFALAGSSIGSTTTNPVEVDADLRIGLRRALHSKILDEERELMVHLPNGYSSSPTQRYPLFVVLDARSSFKPTAAMIHTLSEGGAIPRMIVVAVKNTDRWRDLLPQPSFGIPGSGGGAAFLESLGSEIIPWIDTHFRTNGFRVFSGHSLGGLTVLHALKEEPGLFDAYISLSPSVEAADGIMVEQFRDFLDGEVELRKMLYLAIADEAMERPYYDELVRTIDKKAPDRLFWISDVFEEEDDHMSIRITGGLAGIRWVFRDWRLSSRRIYSMSEEELDRHFTMASKRYKEKLELSMMPMTDAGYWGLYDATKRDRAMAFFRLAVRRWPDRAYPYSCLGEGLERTGDFEGALEQMEKALGMAKQQEHRDIPYFQGMVDRVRASLGREVSTEP